MTHSNPFGARSTADQVLAGVDLGGKRFVVTGCDSGIGFETMNALAANGASVIGLARSSAQAAGACARVGPTCIPVACELSDLASVDAAARSIDSLDAPLDAIVANAGLAFLPTLETRNGVEMQFLVNHIGHFALINALSGRVREGTGRIIIVTGGAAFDKVPGVGIDFDNLDGHRLYDAAAFYRQSKLAAALYAKELSRRLRSRGIAVNSVHPGVTRGTRLDRYRRPPWTTLRAVAKWFRKSVQQGAATQALLAASPRTAGISGEHWRDCWIVPPHPVLDDLELAGRLWEVSQRIAAGADARTASPALQRAA